MTPIQPVQPVVRVTLRPQRGPRVPVPRPKAPEPGQPVEGSGHRIDFYA